MSSRVRILTLLLLFVACGTFYLFQNPDSLAAFWLPPPLPPSALPLDRSGNLRLEASVKASVRHYFDGIHLSQQENNLNHAMQLDREVARPQIARGQYRDAYRTYQKILAISYGQGDLQGIVIALGAMASILERADNMDEALFTVMLAYKAVVRTYNNEEIGVVELEIARMLDERDPGASMMWAMRAKDHLKDSHYKEDYVRALPVLARNLQRLRQDDKASQILAEAWEKAKTLGDSQTLTSVGVPYADDLSEAGKYDKALEVLLAVEPSYSPEQRSTDVYAQVLHRLAKTRVGLKQTTEAGRDFLAAYAVYEVTRADAPGEAARARLDASEKDLVDDFVDSRIESKDFASALALLESNKARTLNEVLEDPSYKSAQDQWREMERRQAKEVAALTRAPGDPLVPSDDRETFRKFTDLMEKQEDERRHLQEALQLKEMIVTRNLSKEQVQQIGKKVPADVALLSFFVGEKKVSLFLVTQRGIQYLPLAIDAPSCEQAVRQLRVALTNPDNDFYREPAQWLFKNALAPAVRALPPGVKILVYSPDGPLSGIPLEALMDGERFLGERFAVYRIPSLRYATSIAAVKAPPVRRGIACVDPDIPGGRLPFQQETGRVLDKLYGAGVTSLAGKECSESKLVAAIKSVTQPSFLHIGAHGKFYPINPMESAIWLTPEGESGSTPPAWSAKAMATVDMHQISLVTLSSCETGLTDSNRPRDLFGIARALFFSGVKIIVAPLWAVHDQATAEYMRAFHSAYGRNVPAVLALQQAQCALLKSARYRHPFYWSAFVLTGAGR